MAWFKHVVLDPYLGDVAIMHVGWSHCPSCMDLLVCVVEVQRRILVARLRIRIFGRSLCCQARSAGYLVWPHIFSVSSREKVIPEVAARTLRLERCLQRHEWRLSSSWSPIQSSFDEDLVEEVQQPCESIPNVLSKGKEPKSEVCQYVHSRYRPWASRMIESTFEIVPLDSL